MNLIKQIKIYLHMLFHFQRIRCYKHKWKSHRCWHMLHFGGSCGSQANTRYCLQKVWFRYEQKSPTFILIKKENFVLPWNGEWKFFRENIPKHVVPFPVNPFLQKQVKEPSVLVQVAFVWQLWVPKEHSSLSRKRHVGFSYP